MHDDALADVTLELSVAALALVEALVTLAGEVLTFAESLGERHDALVDAGNELEVIDA